MLSNRDIICISSIDWDFVWQGHQQIMSTLAACGNRVLFIDNTGVRSPTVRDLVRLKQRISNWRRGTKGFRQENENLFVFSPLILPFPYSRIARWINCGVLIKAIRRWMQAVGFGRPVLWIFLPTPLACDIVQKLGAEMTLYYCIDDFASSSVSARRVSRSEVELFRKVDLVFVTSELLREKAFRVREQVHFFPFGVDFKRFEQVRNDGSEIPVDLQEIRRPVVGYVGGIHRWVDQELLAGTASRMPEVSFVLVGPIQTNVSKLTRYPNIHLLGSRPHTVVPYYIKGFDVGLIPYKLGEYTDHVYPTKLNEYFAMGIPVVASNLPEIRRFNVENGGIVNVGHGVEGFVEAIHGVVARGSSNEIQRRIEVARSNGWEARIGKMSALIEEVLQARRVEGGRWEKSLRFLYDARRRLVGIVSGIVLAWLSVFYTPLPWIVAEPLRMMDAPRPVDTIVVFAGGVGESGKAGGGYQERVKHAVDLYRDGYAPHLIFSSGYVSAFKEAKVMEMLAISRGIPKNVIILEETASSTIGNVNTVRRILQRRGWRNILLVSSPYHMRRCLLTFRKLAPDVKVVASPIPYSQFYSHRVGANFEQIKSILHEYGAIGYYWWKGWL